MVRKLLCFGKLEGIAGLRNSINSNLVPIVRSNCHGITYARGMLRLGLPFARSVETKLLDGAKFGMDRTSAIRRAPVVRFRSEVPDHPKVAP